MRAWKAPWRWRTPLAQLSDPEDRVAQVLMNDAPDGMLLTDADGRILRANAALRRLAGEAASGRSVDTVFAEAERESAMRALHPVLNGREATARFVTRLAAMVADPVSGTAPAAEVTASVLLERGAPYGVLLRVTDISRLRRIEAQLADGQRLQAVGQLAGGIAHDFNNLLTAISGAAELALAAPGGGAAHEELREILAAAGRGAALVRRLLAFGRQEAPQPCAMAINDAIAELAGLLRRLLGERITLHLELERPGRQVRVDPSQLDQVLVNLAVNARDAMADGGTLTVRTGYLSLFRPLTRRPDTIPPGRYVVVEVQDTGTGIPPEVLPQIFEPFFTTKRATGGTGLGLSTVRGIMHEAGGFITVESEVGRGTRVRLLLPRHEAEAGDHPAESAATPLGAPGPVPQPPATAGRCVLLVEDEAAVRRLAEIALARQGWQVLAAPSAEEALEAARAAIAAGTPPALVISDVVMPGMEGPALLRALRDLVPGLPAILVSGYAGEALGEDAGAERTGGAAAWLAKPYTLEALTALAARVADGG